MNKARRVLRVNSGSAFVAGFTLSGGHCQSESGSGVYIDANGGTVSNCVIQGCYTENWNGDGAGAYVSRQGLLVDSVIRECRFGPSTFFCQYTMSVLAVYGTVENCLVCDCNDATYMQNIVGVHSGGRLVNCTVANCTCRPDFEGKNASTQQSQAYPRRVGVWAEAGSSIVNCAVLGVRRETEPGSGVMEPAPWRDAAAGFDHCATEGEAVNATCVTADTGVFRDFASGDYRLASTESNPLVNAGAAVALHTTLDMARKPRVMCRDIDIGCYEDQNAGMVILCR